MLSRKGFKKRSNDSDLLKRNKSENYKKRWKRKDRGKRPRQKLSVKDSLK